MRRFEKYFLFFLMVWLPLVGGDVAFMDCGSQQVFIDKIDIPGCVDAPCLFYRGSRYHVFITPDHLDPIVDSIELAAYVRLWGALFSVSATCTNPCVTECPLRHQLERPRLDFVVEVPLSFIRHPGILYIKAIHKNRGQVKATICVSVNINLA